VPTGGGWQKESVKFQSCEPDVQEVKDFTEKQDLRQEQFYSLSKGPPWNTRSISPE
jgi:hypothetical protein